jgi:O-antigen ligase
MKSVNLKQKIGIMVGIFFLIQAFSYLAYLVPVFSGIFFWLIILSALALAIKKTEYGFCFLLFEFFLGHEGHLFEFAGISLRLALFLVLMLVWGIKKISKKQVADFLKNILADPGLALFLILCFVIVLSFFQGLIRHGADGAIKDFINYAYLILIFPFLEIFKNKEMRQKFFVLAGGAILGLSVLTLIIFILTALGIIEVHDQFYWWWRGTIVGKITDAGNNFWRIVTPAHLLVLPSLLVALSFLIRKKISKNFKKIIFFLAGATSLALVINFSRAYFLGIVGGLIFLKKNINFSKWLKFTLLIILILIVEFVLIFGLVSGGKIGEGLKFFKGRMETVVQPGEEASSLTRMNILPRLVEKIKIAPLFGQGLGATIGVFDAVINQERITFHLDWGYFEMWHEIGLFGLVVYGLLIFYLFYFSFKQIKELGKESKEAGLVFGLLAGLISLLIANLTAPVLFHSLGIFYFILTWSLVFNLKKHDF